MVDATSTNKYLTVSIWANSWTAVTNSGEFVIRFASSPWASYENDWKAPTTPVSASFPDIPI